MGKLIALLFVSALSLPSLALENPLGEKARDFCYYIDSMVPGSYTFQDCKNFVDRLDFSAIETVEELIGFYVMRRRVFIQWTGLSLRNVCGILAEA